MAHQWMRCNLASAIFPFATELWGRSIIVPQYDQNFDRLVNPAADKDKDKGVPQAYYMHNCMPTSQGYQAIGYNSLAASVVPAVTIFDQAFPFQTPTLDRFLFSPAGGKNYVYSYSDWGWRSVSPIAVGTLAEDVVLTTAFIQAQTYFYYSNYGCLVYDHATPAMTPTVLTGLVAADIKGITAANGYMIAWGDVDVSWSSLVDPIDFTPSLVTGAGGGSVGEASGRIIACLAITGGFLIYCEKNVVAAKYSGNIRFPFILQALPNSGGITTPADVSWQSNLADHYAWTTFGLQQLSLTSCKLVFPELTDFLAARIFEDFNEDTLVFTTSFLSASLNVQVTAIAGRYVVCSYGVSSPDFTHALIYDTSLGRWGKFKIDHRDCFEWNFPFPNNLTYDDLSVVTYERLDPFTYSDLLQNFAINKSIAFLQKDGTVKTVVLDLAQTTANGVLMVGKFQFQRNKYIVHQSTDVENVIEGNSFDMYIVPSLDGKTLLPPVACYLQYDNSLSKRYLKRLTGLNFSGLFIGAFNLTSLLINFTLGGDR